MKEIVFEKSFASHPKSKHWSNKNKKNCDKYYKSSNEKCWFNCNQCPHEFLKQLNDISSGYWCPYCSQPPKKLCENDDCLECFNKSFASDPKSQFWSNKNKLNPRQVFKSSGKKFILQCNICTHEFESQLDSILKGSWCSYCNNKKLCKKDCIECFNKSFASHNKSRF